VEILWWRRKIIKTGKDIIETAKAERLKELAKEIEEKTKKIQELNNELNFLKKGELPKNIKKLIIWLQQNPPIKYSTSDKIDPIFGHLHIEEEIIPILFHPLVQRLNFIRQLSFNYVENAAGNHTRLAHSLGVCKNAELALSTIFRKGALFSRNGKKSIDLSDSEKRKIILTAKVAGLVHDIGHGPFGHALDRYIGFSQGIKHPDKKLAVRYIETYLSEVLKANGFEPRILANIINSEKEGLTAYEQLVADIIDSPLDVDRMDYLIRDAYGTGLSLGFVNTKTLIESMTPFIDENDNIMLTYHCSALPYIEHFIYARDAMFAKCYESPIKVSGEGMLIKAIDDFLKNYDLKLDDILLLDDDQLLDTIIAWSDIDATCFKLASYIKKGLIFEQVYEIPLAKSDTPEVNAWRERRTAEDDAVCYIERPREWERILSRSADLREDWKILVSVPSPEVTEPRQVNVTLLEESEEGTGYKTQLVHEKSLVVDYILELLTKVRSLFRVFVSPDLSTHQKDIVRNKAKEIFGEF
jgi:HD superfamily phosphohydrolase